MKLPSLILVTPSPVLRTVDADALSGWSVLFPRVLDPSRLVVGLTSGCSVHDEALTHPALVKVDAEPPGLVDASLVGVWSVKGFKVVLVLWWLETLEKSGLVAGAGVTLLCVSFLLDVAFPPSVITPRLVFGPPVASVDPSVVRVAAVGCWGVTDVL